MIEDGACARHDARRIYQKKRRQCRRKQKCFPTGRFPLLIKFIDAADRLSVQVHPDDAYAARVENGVGKTEMWYVIDAAPGAQLVMGLSDGKTPDDLRAEARSGGDVSDCLRYVPVSAGDCFFIPSGMVHAIGSGILIAEIQQNCDLTYRVWDYGRLGKDGKPRELHTEKACDVIRSFTDGEVEAERFESLAGDGKTCLPPAGILPFASARTAIALTPTVHPSTPYFALTEPGSLSGAAAAYLSRRGRAFSSPRGSAATAYAAVHVCL